MYGVDANLFIVSANVTVAIGEFASVLAIVIGCHDYSQAYLVLGIF
jgi:hypothetical protein